MNFFKTFYSEKSNQGQRRLTLNELNNESATRKSGFDLSKLFGGKTTSQSNDKSKWNTTCGGKTPF